MAILLCVIESTFRDEYGVAAEPGMRLSDMEQRAEFRSFRQGIILELRSPDATLRRTHLVNYGVGVTNQSDGSILVEADPLVRLTLPSVLAADDLRTGTEIWWLDDEPGMSDDEVEKILNAWQRQG